MPFKLLSGLKVHMESHLGKKYICPVRNKISSIAFSLINFLSTDLRRTVEHEPHLPHAPENPLHCETIQMPRLSKDIQETYAVKGKTTQD